MSKVKISKDKSHFIKNGEKFFFLADTCWSAFTNISFSEWEEYLDYRKYQGFNIVQINILPQWDASESDIDILPFSVNDNGTWNYENYNEEYFERAEKMLEIAIKKGFTPALVVLWCNYVPETWASKMISERVIPIEYIDNYVSYVGNKFNKFDPIFMISGDTNFESEISIDYYRKALEGIKKVDSEATMTMHICGRLMEMPEEFEDSKDLDFYMFQSGHNSSHMDMPYLLAEKFYNKKIRKPSVNSELCYEGMGYSRNVYGRFNRFDVRKALWQSLLSGASAGITYGAHGIWSWHKKGKGFGIKGEGFDSPYPWSEALRFQGAWDYSYAKWLFEKLDLFGIKPIDGLIKKSSEIRMSATENFETVLIYVPVNTVLVIEKEFSNYEFELVDLANRYVAKADVQIKDGKTIVGLHNFLEDVLVIAKKK